jgi:hypothetical protein
LCTFITLDALLKSDGMAGKKERDQLQQTVYHKNERLEHIVIGYSSEMM